MTNERRTAVFEQLIDENPEALQADGFEKAFVGICRRFGQPSVAMYDQELCVEILVERDGMEEEEAIEFFDFKVIGACVGENTPVFCTLAT